MNFDDQKEIFSIINNWDFELWSDWDAFFEELESKFTVERKNK